MMRDERQRWKAEELAFYKGHSSISDPGVFRDRVLEVPADIDQLQRAANGLVIHFRLDDPVAIGIPEGRLGETENRYAETIFECALTMDSRPLTCRREASDRVVGCCRDFTVVLLAMARSLGLSARARVGFATYFFEGANNDHMVAEVWDTQDCRWRLVDPQLKPDHIDPNDGLAIDPCDVPRDRFLTAGAAWRSCTAREADAEMFLVHPDVDMAATRSWPYIGHNMVLDLAALNRVEVLLWDLWGLAGKVLSPKGIEQEDRALLEQIAAVTGGVPRFPEVRPLYENHELLRVPDTVLSVSPTVPGLRQVALR